MMRFLMLVLFVTGCSAAPHESYDMGGAPLGQGVSSGGASATDGAVPAVGDTTTGGASGGSDMGSTGGVGSMGSGGDPGVGGSGGEPPTCDTPSQLNLPDSFPWSEESSENLYCEEGWDCDTQAFLFWDEPVPTSADGLEWDIRLLRQETTAGYALTQNETECLGETVEIEASDPEWWNINYHVVLSDEPGFPLKEIYLREESGDYSNPEKLEDYSALPGWIPSPHKPRCNYFFLTELTVQAIRSAFGSCG